MLAHRCVRHKQKRAKGKAQLLFVHPTNTGYGGGKAGRREKNDRGF
jgi:hypothetical protein